MQKQYHLLPFFAFLLLISGKVMSQLGPNGLPLYEEGKLYLQIKQSSSIAIHNKDTVVNDFGGIFLSLFSKYHVVHTNLPFAFANHPSLNKIYQIYFNDSARVDSFVIELSAISSHVDYAEKVPAVYSHSIAIDPLSINTTSTGYNSTSYHLTLLNANQASNIHVSTGNVTVAVVDDAVLTTHDDLAANIGTVNVGQDMADGDSDPNPPFVGPYPVTNSYFTHGTHVAGIAGAVTNNSIGVSSIGWNNKIMCVKTRSNTESPLNSYYTHPYQGVVWAAQHGAKVINMSWGAYGYSQTHYTAITLAKSYGVVLIGSAGNEFVLSPNYPAAYGEGTTGQTWEVFDKKLVVAVAGLDQNNNIGIWPNYSGSNYGAWVDISAYGTDILSTIANSSMSTAITNQYAQFNGTSMAAPMISGIAGVMRSFAPNKTADQIIDCLINTANPDIYGSAHPGNQPGTLGSGRADAAAALQCLSSNCTVNPIVIILPSSTSLCANATLTLTTNQGPTSYSWSTGATSSSIVVNAPGTYSVIATYTTGGNCTSTASIAISSPPTLSLSLSTNTSICPGVYTFNLISASGNYTSLVWQPGSITSNSAIINPTAYTIYSVTANPLCGGTTATIGVSPSYYALTTTSISVIGPTLSGNYTGNNFIIQDAIVNTYAKFSTINNEINFAPNVKITVPSSGTLVTHYTTLHACGTDMWKGVVINDGSEINCAYSTIEDAEIAISSTHTPQSIPGLLPGVIKAFTTTFNKNYRSISLTNYYDNLSPPISYSNTVQIHSCVFTCRNSLPFNVTSVGGSRHAYTPTTGISVPYTMVSATLTTLKSPFLSLRSHEAIKLVNCGVTTGTNYVGLTIGNAAQSTTNPPEYFNLFDGHEVFISALNSNLTLVNNVFQNTQAYSCTVNIGNVPVSIYFPGKSAIQFSVNNPMGAMLDMTAPNVDVGNRFWDCHTSIEATKLYRFNMTNAIIRSTQSSTALPATNFSPPGQYGLNFGTNRYMYNIHDNEFTNVANAINIGIAAGQYTTSAICNSCAIPNGILATSIHIYDNAFGSGTVTNSYMNKAVNIDVVNQIPPIVSTDSVTPNVRGVFIETNTITNAYRGIYTKGVTAFPLTIKENTITLREDNIFGISQHAIDLSNSIAGGTINPMGQHRIQGNVLSSNTITNSLSSAVFCEINAGVYSPSVTCNELNTIYTGFNFYGPNSHAVWAGNIMQPLSRGLALTNAGVIGQQGGPSTANANKWNGTWTPSVNIGTYVGPASSASNSILWVKNTSATLPPNNSGTVTASEWFGISTGYVQITGAGDYNCSGVPNNISVPLPVESDYANAELYYISKTAFYRFLSSNDSVVSSNSDYSDFLDDLSASSVANFYAVEKKIDEGELAIALSTLAGIDDSDFNLVEENYRTFYTLYLNLDEEESYSTTDSSALISLCQLCPSTNGACVYQARALYNFIYKTVVDFDGCGSLGARIGHYSDSEKQNPQTIYEPWNIKLFPNPAQKQITIISNIQNEFIDIELKDITGRLIQKQHLKADNSTINLEVNLVNGIYFIVVKSSNREKIIKKVVIAN